MGKSFRKDSAHNKFARRDKDAKQKFSKKFLKPNTNKLKRVGVVDTASTDTKFPEND